MDVLGAQESGDKYRLEIEGLSYAVELPWVRLPADGKRLRIASLNLVGQVRLNADLGRLLAAKISTTVPDLSGTAVLTVVEKGLMLTQVAAMELGIDAVAVAYNRVKPHMEATSRPVIQIGADSITSGGKFLALYERDLNLLTTAERFIFIDDVISTGGTLLSLVELLQEALRLAGRPEPDIVGIFCVAEEGERHPLLPASVHSLAKLPKPAEEQLS